MATSRTDIAYEQRDAVGILTINRPEVLNAFRPSTYRELLEILEETGEDETIRALVITGTGRAFCAGEDLKSLESELNGAMGSEAAAGLLATLQEITRTIVHHPKTIIAAVNGIAVGFGAELSIACDMRVAADTARFGFPESKRSLVITNGAMFLLPRIVGWGRAREWMLTSDMISAETAREAGLVNRVVPSDQLIDSALELATTIANNAPISIRIHRKILNRSYDLDLEAVMRLEVEGCVECLASADVQEGVRSFIERRPPVYRGV